MLDSKRELSVGRAGIRIRPGTRGLASCLYVTTFGYYSRKPLKSQFNETLSPDWILLTDCCRVGSKLVVVPMPKKDYFSWTYYVLQFLYFHACGSKALRCLILSICTCLIIIFKMTLSSPQRNCAVFANDIGYTYTKGAGLNFFPETWNFAVLYWSSTLL